MELIEFVGLCCIIITLFMFGTGISPCLKMYRTGNVREAPFILFLMSVVSCAGMVHYGLLQDDNILIFLNVVGLILNFIYMMVYIMVVRSKSAPLAGVLIGMIYMAGLYWYCFNVIIDPKEYTSIIGTSSSSITTLLILLGGVEVYMNIQQKNSDGMAPIMWVGGLLCGISWLTYGLLVNDPTIYSPNIPSLVTGTLKMYCLAVYPKSDERKKME